ncbi:inositol monophosphatase family protein [Marispirochaeta aestuarii]|uniref:inositol monophosphatase family protein n=1 Tax=Marispirochaeta aestuarii TaxID=1963862 RepID=UPI0029C86A53|nr:inositol monophosphatase family protein [Marispirochaeta aestuarii]
MTEWNPEVLAGLLDECGRIALDLYDDPGISVKNDQSLVTRADHAVEGFLAQSFHKPEEGSFLIGEETIATRSSSYIKEAFRHTAWIVDPIDGTVPYAHHLAHWGVSVGFMQQGRLTEGAVYLPVTREYYISHRGEILYARPAPGEKPVLAPLKIERSAPGEKSIVGISQDVVRGKLGSLANPVQTLGCVVVPFAYMLQGRFMAYVGYMKLWDLAGSLPLLRNAGFIVRSADGQDLDPQISPGQFVLDPDHERFCYLRSNLIAAPNEEIYQQVRSRVSLPEVMIPGP